MRKFVLAGLGLALSIGFAIAGEVAFVKFNADTKELTVKDGDKEVTYKITDDTKIKRGDKDVPADKVGKVFEKAKEGTKFELTADGKTVKEIVLKGKAK